MNLQFFVILLYCFTSLSASIIIDNNDYEINKFKLPYFYDETRSLKIDQIEKFDFDQKTNNQFTFGYLKGNLWFRFDITNNSNKDEIILHMTEPFFDEVNLFELIQNRWYKHQSGLHIDLNLRDMYDISAVFVLKIKPGTTKRYYVQTYAKFAQFGEFKIYTNRAFVTNYRLFINSLYIFFFGSLFMVIIFNLFLYIRLKEKIYLYYVSYIFFHTIFVIGFSGLTIYCGLSNLHYKIHLISIPFLIIFLILFETVQNFVSTSNSS
ncbi:7TM-DISM domain-containing protein [Hydrogenimonas thermophila]|uniref:7TM diverse intracellular signalling n=1 Tax=Hydrogenimonas thermophila TaxID=223786 RepID=A0A1I5SK41_9BACT|nr:7TM-DISM domain-containing protein [Hydrogenimonas thermophila]SFP71073.1 7TM diverse intracellular signalling [Hydrogenimonas thermophila]